MLSLTLMLSISTSGALFAKGTLKKSPAGSFRTSTPIKHVVVIFPENVTFDHFFATYPKAQNPVGEPRFKAKSDTPTVNGLNTPFFVNNLNGVAPFRLSRSQAATCDPINQYEIAQIVNDNGFSDIYEFANSSLVGCTQSMGYFDGNTVTALWNYAQFFAMSDNSYSTTFGPSSPGAVNLISGQTHGAQPPDFDDVTLAGTLFNDIDPAFDTCSNSPTVSLTGQNVGDLLNAKNITWGWFQGGFSDCTATHIGSDGNPVADYVPHHEPFQFYSSTSNPNHLPPSSVSAIGFTDQANHQYDLTYFWAAVANHNIPAVSYLKPAAYQDCHPGYSDPLAFQTFLVNTMNQLQELPEWKEMAVFIVFDDFGGWYDHVSPPIINTSMTPADFMIPLAELVPFVPPQLPPYGGYQARMGYGQRLPFLVLSPFAKCNFVDHSVTDQTSVLRFIEDNWDLGRIGDFSFDEFAGSLDGFFDFRKPCYRKLILDPTTGKKVKCKSDCSKSEHKKRK